eukprot:2100238-Prymnesium_polylepis.1
MSGAGGGDLHQTLRHLERCFAILVLQPVPDLPDVLAVFRGGQQLHDSTPIWLVGLKRVVGEELQDDAADERRGSSAIASVPLPSERAARIRSTPSVAAATAAAALALVATVIATLAT